jgi:hypothetical protein
LFLLGGFYFNFSYMKNKKYLEEDKPVSKPGKKKSKDWIVEYKWKSIEDFNKYPKTCLDLIHIQKNGDHFSLVINLLPLNLLYSL